MMSSRADGRRFGFHPNDLGANRAGRCSRFELADTCEACDGHTEDSRDPFDRLAELRAVGEARASKSMSDGRFARNASSVARVDESIAMNVPEMNVTARRTPIIAVIVRRRLRKH